MAGDWIKLQHATPDKPEVYQIAEELGLDPDTVVGKLVRAWIWADQQTENGHIKGGTKRGLDAVTRCDGFGTALVNCGWLTDGEDMHFVNYLDHNGQNAKKRAKDALRKAKQRANVTPESGQKEDKNVTREEKSIEEKKREDKERNTNSIPF